MDPRRANTERNMLPTVGPSFFRGEGDAILFQFVIDTGNVIGPRPATRSDQEKHPDAWAAFSAAEGVSSLDRDAKGGPGGSLPAESPPRTTVEAASLTAAAGGAGGVAAGFIVGGGRGAGGPDPAPKKSRKPPSSRKKA